MGKKIVTRTAKIQSESKKTKGKEAVAIAYEHIPRSPEEQNHGSLYAVIELEDTSGHAEEIAEKIIDILHDEYYEDLTRDPLASLEASLAKINEDLAERSSEGQIHWLGKLNAILAIVSGSTIHITQGGKAEAYLYRGEHAMHITEGLTGDNINPLRTFINIASGELATGDKVILATPGVFYKLSKNELKKFVSESAPRKAAENISKIISGDTGSSAPNAVLILETISPETLVLDTPEDESDNDHIWIDNNAKPLDDITEQTIHGTIQVFDTLGKYTSAAALFGKTKALPAIKNGFSKIAGAAQGVTDQKNTPEILLSSEEKIIRQPNDLNLTDQDELGDGILEETRNPEPIEREIRIKETDHRPKILSLERFNFTGLTGLKNNATNAFKRVRLPKGKSSVLYLALGLILVAGIGVWSILGAQNKKSQEEAENIFNQANSKYEQSLTESNSGQRELALENLAISEKLLSDSSVEKYKKAEADALRERITIAKDQALGIVRNTSTDFADFSDPDVSEIFSDGTNLYGINFSNGKTYKAELANQAVSTVTEEAGLDGKIKFATIVTSRRVIVAYTEPGSLFEISLVTGRTSKQNVTGTLEPAIGIASFGSNIYLLSPEKNQIFKYTKNSGGYGSKSNYLVSPETNEVSTAIAFSIDSSVYTLSSDGFIKKFTSGRRQTYTPNDLPQNIQNPLGVFANPDVSGIYVYTKNNSIFKIDENQKFVAQYQSDKIKDLKSILVNDDSQTIFTLSEGKIFQTKF